jgi:hypothetical protein
MKARELYNKTMPFAWAKLMLGLATTLIAAVLFAIFWGLALLFNSGGVAGFIFIVWLCAVGFVRFVLMHYLGYMVKAGHIAVMVETLMSGRVPDNQVEYGKQLVLARFVTSNAYFAADKLVSGAVRQIQRGIGKLGNALSFVPGMSSVVGLAQYFVELSLGYVDECCLGYSFYKKDQGALKSAADGVVIYAQNWKTLLADAAKTMLMVVLGTAGATIVIAIALGIVFRLFSWPGWVAFALALLAALAVKTAFIDSFILARTMVSYMGVAPGTVITYDLYNSLSGVSAKFKELYNKGQQERLSGQPALAGAGAGAGAFAQPQPAAQPAAQAQAAKPVFCGQCGAKNNAGVKFCGSCGAPLS